MKLQAGMDLKHYLQYSQTEYLKRLQSGFTPAKNFSERLDSIRYDLAHQAAERFYINNYIHLGNLNKDTFLSSVQLLARQQWMEMLFPSFRRTFFYESVHKNTLNLIETNLTTAIEQHYTPMQIIMKIEAQLLGELRAMGYGQQDPNPADMADVYEHCLAHLNTVFPDQGRAWLVTGADLEPGNEIEGQSIVDLNWSLIRKNILEQLKTEKFISSDEQLLIKGINFNDAVYYYLNFADKNSGEQWVHSIKKPSEVLAISQAFPKDHELQEYIKTQIVVTINRSGNIVPELHSNFDLLKNPNYTESLVSAIQRCGPSVFTQELKPASLDNEKGPLELVLSYGHPSLITQLLGSCDVELRRTLFQENKDALMNIAMKRYPDMAVMKAIQEVFNQGNPNLFSYTFKLEHCKHAQVSDEALNQVLARQNYDDISELLHFSINANPNLYAKLLRYLESLPLNAQARVLNKQLLRHALTTQPLVVPELLQLIEAFTAREKTEFFMEKVPYPYMGSGMVEYFGSELLMSTAGVLPQLLKTIGTLSKEEQFLIFKRANNPIDGGILGAKNLLVRAIEEQPKDVPEILKFISAFSYEEQIKIFMGTDRPDKQSALPPVNILWLSIGKQPEILSALLKFMETLQPEDKIKILLDKNPNRYTRLTQAIRDKEQTLPELLQFIGTLAVEDQSIIFLENSQLFLYAMQHQPEVIPQLLQAITSLTAEKKVEILKQTASDAYPALDKNGPNLLMLAVQYRPTQVPSLFTFIKTLPPEDQISILLQKNRLGRNALMCAAMQNTQVILDLYSTDKETCEQWIKIIKDPGELVTLSRALPVDHELQGLIKAQITAKIERSEYTFPDLLKIGDFLKQEHYYQALIKTIVNAGASAFTQELHPESADPGKGLVEFVLTHGHPDLITGLVSQYDPALRLQLFVEQREAFMKIVMKRFPDMDVLNAIQQVFNEGNTGLLVYSGTLEQCKHPQATDEMLDSFVRDLCDKEGEKDYNVIIELLFFVLKERPNFSLKLLQAIGELPDKDKIEILQKQNNYRYNALMHAVTYCPEAVSAILQVINTLPVKDRSTILRANHYEDNALSMAARSSCPTAVTEILQVINTLPVEDKLHILQKRNLLQLAAQYQPAAVQPLLACIDTLTAQEKTEILLLKRDDNGSVVLFGALGTAGHYQPTAVPVLLKAMADLPSKQQKILVHIRCEPVLKQLSNEILIECLRSISKAENPALLQAKILKQKQKFTAEDWYTIVNENLLPAEQIKSKKEKVYEHITKIAKAQPEVVSESLNRNSALGTFFNTQRGFRACGPGRGTFKRLENLQKEVGEGDNAEPTPQGPVK